MFKTKMLFCGLVLTMVMAGTTPAGLWDPPVLNNSFEAQDLSGTPWSNWIDDWFDSSYWGTFIQIEGGLIPITPYDSNWGGVDTGTMYQQIGTWGPGVAYEITVLLGQRSDRVFGDMTIGLWAGGEQTGDPGSGGTTGTGDSTTPTSIGATLIDSVVLNPFAGTPGLATSEESVTLNTGTGQTIGDELWISFSNPGSQSFLDNVNIAIPNAPVLIYPVNKVNEPWDLTLVWDAPPTFTPGGYNIYLDPNELEVSIRNPLTKINTVLDTDPNYDVTGLAHGVRYYWLVEARQDPVTTPPTDPNWIPSVVATFTTAPDEPIITTHPESQTVAATTEVILTVEADNATGYQWYKDGISLLGKTDPSLTLTSVALGDEGYYRCDVSNASDTVSSDTARLMIQRLVGQWTFEETIDAVVGDFTGTYVDPNVLAHGNVPVYDADAMEGSWAINFPGPDLEGLGEHIAVSDPNFFDFYPQGFTASVWIKTTFTANWSGYVSKHHRTPDAGWIIYSDGNVAVATMRSAWTGDHYGSTTVTDGAWHLLVNQYDPVAKVLRLYVDGELENTSGTVGGALPVTTSGTPVLIGADRPGGSFSANGLVDDVRIWNHALDPVTIAYLYTDATGETVCTSDDGTAGPMDFNEDCIVNIKDLAEFAAKWLECYIVPTCLP